MAVAQTTLSAALSTTNATSITVRDALGFAATTDTDDLILIGSEYLLVTAGMGTLTWTVTRGYASSTAATASNGATVTRIERGWTNLSRLRTQLSITDTDDDTLLLDIIEAVNAELTDRVGVFLGPSTDTLRLYGGEDVVRNGYRLLVPGGIRTLTQVRTATQTGGSWTTQTLTDFVLGPPLHTRRTGEPYAWVDVSEVASALPMTGLANIELTGTFGRASVASNLAKVADMVATRMWNDRNAGTLANPTASKFIFPDDAALLMRHRAEQFAMAR